MPDCAVVVGINRYPYLDSLRGPETDARDFHDWLLRKASDPLKPGHAHLILSSSYPDEADMDEPTTDKIDRAFQAILRLRKDNDPVIGNRLYIFLAGHGFSTSINDASLLMANAARTATGFHVAGRAYADWFVESGCFREVVLFMDCCRENHRRAPIRQPPWDQQQGTAGANCYGFATEWSTEAREIQMGTPPVFRGRFTAALMDGLRGAAADPATGRVSGKALEEFVFNTLTQQLPGQPIQEPRFVVSNPTIDFGAPATPPYLVRWTPGPNDTTPPQLLDGDLKVIAPDAGTASIVTWSLYRGLYLVVRPRGNERVLALTSTGGVYDV